MAFRGVFGVEKAGGPQAPFSGAPDPTFSVEHWRSGYLSANGPLTENVGSGASPNY